MKTTQVILITLCIVLIFSDANTSDRYNVRSLGMGRTVVASTRGIEALSVNPANLGIPDGKRVTISLAPVNVRVGTELFPYDVYQKYFTGVDTGGPKRAPYYLTDHDKQTIRDQLPENGATFIDVESMYAGISAYFENYGGVGFGIIDHAGCRITLSRDFFDLFYLNGLPSNSTYTFDGTSFSAWWYREYNLSYGRKIPIVLPFIKNIYTGAGIKFVRGYGIFQTVENRSSLTNSVYLSPDDINTLRADFNYRVRRAGTDFFRKTKSDSDDVRFSLFPDPAGKGVGFDIGISAELLNGIILGISVVDIGKITWERNIVETKRQGILTIQGFEKDLGDTVRNTIKGENTEGEAFSTALPTVLRIGATLHSDQVPFLHGIPGKMLFAIEYAQGFNNVLGNTTKPRFSFGVEYKIIPFMPIRTGVLIGGGDDVRWSFGSAFDFNYIALEFATDNFAMVFSPNSFNVISVSAGIKVRI
ncbi:MAG: DUF5723 family protein [Bacteroidetes bacterium]|nr:DUF5723 family protein [Bacteroidota bacterium]